MGILMKAGEAFGFTKESTESSNKKGFFAERKEEFLDEFKQRFREVDEEIGGIDEVEEIPEAEESSWVGAIPKEGTPTKQESDVAGMSITAELTRNLHSGATEAPSAEQEEEILTRPMPAETPIPVTQPEPIAPARENPAPIPEAVTPANRNAVTPPAPITSAQGMDQCDFLLVTKQEFMPLGMKLEDKMALDFAIEIIEHQLSNPKTEKRVGMAIGKLLTNYNLDEQIADKLTAQVRQEYEERIQKFRGQISGQNDQIIDLKGQLKMAGAEIASLKKKCDALARGKQELEGDVADLTSQLAMSKQSTDEYLAQLRKLHNEASRKQSPPPAPTAKGQGEQSSTSRAHVPDGQLAGREGAPRKDGRATGRPESGNSGALLRSETATPSPNAANAPQPANNPANGASANSSRLPHPAVCYIDEDGRMHDRSVWKREGKPDWDKEIHWKLGNEYSDEEVPAEISRRFRRGEKFSLLDSDYAEAAQEALRRW